jgi:hypothetical protein
LQVRSSFANNAHLTADKDILKAKDTAIKAIGDFYTVKAYEMVMQERKKMPSKLQDYNRLNKHAIDCGSIE